MDTNLFTISVSDFNPVAAAIIANVVSRSYVIFDLEQQMSELQLQYGDKHPIVMQLRDNINKMIQNLSGEPLPAVDAIGPASVKIIEQAQVPLYPTGTSKRIVIFFALIMSLFFGVMLAFGFEYVDQKLKYHLYNIYKIDKDSKIDDVKKFIVHDAEYLELNQKHLKN